MRQTWLSIDTAGSYCSVAYFTRDESGTGEWEITDERISAGGGDHFEQLHNQVAAVLGAERDNSLIGISIGTGPGSFTGIRIGMSFAKGLSLARRCTIVGVPSLESAAKGYVLSHPNLPYSHTVRVVGNAGREELFFAEYLFSSAREFLEVKAPCILPVREVQQMPAHVEISTISIERDLRIEGLTILNFSSPARGGLPADIGLNQFSISMLSGLTPTYLRAVAAQTIEERRAVKKLAGSITT